MFDLFSDRETTREILARQQDALGVWTWPQRQPHRCPVCEGCGWLPAGFYTAATLTVFNPERCRSCAGTGIVWEP